MIYIDALKPIYGTNLIRYDLNFSEKKGLVFHKFTVKMDIPKSGVTPAQSCDVIINGASCNSEIIYRVEPDTTSRTRTYTIYGTLEVKLYGFCETETEMSLILDNFKKTVRGETAHHTQRLAKSIFDINLSVSEL
jgi:hypothetical protein